MSTTYTAIVVVGCKMPKDKVTSGGNVRGCNCEVFEVEGVNFCSNCGQPFWVEKTTCAIKYDPKLGYESLHGLRVFDREYDDHILVAGLHTHGGYSDDIKDSDRLDKTIDLALVKKTIKRTLEPHCLWNEGEFGIWAFLETC